jgi:hypothetical protein
MCAQTEDNIKEDYCQSSCIKKEDMDRTWSTHGEMSAYKTSVEEKTLEKLKFVWEDNIKMNLRNRVQRSGLYSSSLGIESSCGLF